MQITITGPVGSGSDEFAAKLANLLRHQGSYVRFASIDQERSKYLEQLCAEVSEKGRLVDKEQRVTIVEGCELNRENNTDEGDQNTLNLCSDNRTKLNKMIQFRRRLYTDDRRILEVTSWRPHVPPRGHVTVDITAKVMGDPKGSNYLAMATGVPDSVCDILPVPRQEFGVIDWKPCVDGTTESLVTVELTVQIIGSDKVNKK